MKPSKKNNHYHSFVKYCITQKRIKLEEYKILENKLENKPREKY